MDVGMAVVSVGAQLPGSEHAEKPDRAVADDRDRLPRADLGGEPARAGGGRRTRKRRPGRASLLAQDFPVAWGSQVEDGDHQLPGPG